MAYQAWYCEQCGNSSTVRYKKHAGVWEVKEMISAQHRKYRPTTCHPKHGISYVRLGFKPTIGFKPTARETEGDAK